MANYYGYHRTNYFAVTDEAKFREIMSHVYGAEENPQIWEKEINGVKKFGFGAYSALSGYRENADNDFDTDYDLMCNKLQEVVAPGDAIIITEVGYEKLCYLSGYVTVITRDKQDYISLDEASIELAQQLLGNEEYNTQNSY